MEDIRIFNYRLKYINTILIFKKKKKKCVWNIFGVIVEGPHTSVTPPTLHHLHRRHPIVVHKLSIQ
jgi:hypothetical protein